MFEAVKQLLLNKVSWVKAWFTALIERAKGFLSRILG